jgi:DNA-directed RNA polymerase subunit RPC12/RpoP
MADIIVPGPSVKGTEFGIAASQDKPTTDPVVHCDRCGSPMIERTCKLMCMNCGSRIDCSDLSIYMD